MRTGVGAAPLKALFRLYRFCGRYNFLCFKKEENAQDAFEQAWKKLVSQGEAAAAPQKAFTPVGLRKDVQETGPLYHGTRADLRPGDLLTPGYPSNYGRRERANCVYVTARKEGAILAAELAVGEGRARVYLVEPTGSLEDDPNVTDQKFPGNPTRSYRTKAPLRIIGEVSDWEGHSPQALAVIRKRIQEAARLGIEAINE